MVKLCQGASTSKQIQLGKNITLGLGAGSDAETGKKAAEEVN